MQSRKRVWLLFTAIIIAVFAMVGCIPEITPDKTPPDVTAKSVTLSATTINQGDPLTVTVQVTAEDKRSNLKNAQIKLMMKKPGESAFSEVGSITKPFAENVKTDTVSNAFELAGSNFDVGGTYNFKAEIWVSDVKDNVSQEPAEAAPTTSLTVEGAGPVEPTITVTFDPAARPGNLLPETFDITVRGTHPEPELVNLKAELKFGGEQEEAFWTKEASSTSGTTVLEVGEENLHVDIGEEMQKNIILEIVLRDKDGNPYTKEEVFTISKTDIAVIESLASVRGSEEGMLPKVSDYTIPPDDSGDVLQKPIAERLSVPFGLSKIWVSFFDDEIVVGDTVKAYIFTTSTDIFTADPESYRAIGVVNADNKVYLEVPNFWRQSEVDEAKWLVLSVNGTKKFVWNITARGDTLAPIFDITESSEDFDEGVPLYFEAAATDELLEAITDMGIQVNIAQSGWMDLEEAVDNLNISVPADEEFKFAVRYHVKIKVDVGDTTYASGLVDDGIDYIVSNAVTDHANIHWFDVFHGVIPGMPEVPSKQADYWWKTDGLSNLIGEDDDDSYYGGNTNDEEPYATNQPAYKELDHRNLDKRKYVYEFTDLDTTRVQNIMREAFVEQTKFKVWIYPEVVKASKEDLDSLAIKPEVLSVADVAIGPGTWRDQHVDYKVTMELADWRWGGNNPGVGKVQETANFTIEEDELSPTIEISGFDASLQNAPFRKVFRDNDDLFTLSDDVHYPLGMFFIDDVEVFSGGEITIRAKDDIALNDFLVYFDSATNNTDETDQPVAPFINRNADYAHPTAGFDYLYDPDFTVFKLVDGLEEEGVAETVKISNFDPAFAAKRLRLFGEDFRVNGNAITPAFALSKDYEYYVNFTNDDIVSDEEIAAHQNSFGRTNDVYLGNPVNSDYEAYSGEYSNTFLGYVEGENSVNRSKAEFTFTIPDVEPGNYYLWIVARDRSAQDTELFDYPVSTVEDYFAEGSLGEYDPVILKGYQGEIFGNLINDNGSFNYDLEYYDDSMSEDDADMVILLKLRIKTHSWDIMRLDIHDPDLVSFPVEDDCGNPVWYSHSYSPWQVAEEFDDSDMEVERHRLPREIYPVYKFFEDAKEKEEDKFGLMKLEDNPFEVEEYASSPNEDGYHEYMPIVGGENGTDFRVRTHEDITTVKLYLVPGEYWYTEDMEQDHGNLDTSPAVIDSITMTANNADRRLGFWEWPIEDWANVNGHNLMGVEATYTLAVRAYHATVSDPRVFYEQFQWPFFLDTNGPAINLYNVDSTGSDPWAYLPEHSYLDIQDMIQEGLTEADVPYLTDKMVAMQVLDGGAIYFEEKKGVRDSTDCYAPPAPLPIEDLTKPSADWTIAMQNMRGNDMQNHLVNIKAGDTSVYVKYRGESLANFDHSWRLGFPGTGTEVTTDTNLANSLKYLNDGVNDLEFFTRNSVLNNRHMDYMDDLYNTDNLKKLYEGSLPTNALFHNIDFESYVWRSGGQLELMVGITTKDELGNVGEWSSYLTNIMDVTFEASLTKRATELCRDDVLTLSATASEPIVSVRLTELPNGSGITDFGVPITTLIPTPALTITPTITGVLQPAFEATRNIKIFANMQHGFSASTDVTLQATYAGATVTVGINTSEERIGGDIGQELEDAGLSDLALQLYRDLGEGNYVKGLKGLDSDGIQVTINFTAEDDNVDRFYISCDATMAIATDTTADVIPADSSVGASEVTTGSTSVEKVATITENSTFGNIYAGIAGLDCSDSSPTWNASETIRIWYQNLDTYILSVNASPSGATESVTEIVVELQSDLLYEGLDNLKSIFTLERASDGVELTIEEASACNNILGTDTDWETISTSTGARRNQKFWFKVGGFNLGSPRASGDPIPLEKTENGITCKMWDFWAPAIGHYKEVE